MYWKNVDMKSQSWEYSKVSRFSSILKEGEIYDFKSWKIKQTCCNCAHSPNLPSPECMQACPPHAVKGQLVGKQSVVKGGTQFQRLHVSHAFTSFL